MFILTPLEEPGGILEEGGAYSDGLDIFFPEERARQVMAVVRSLHPDLGGSDADIIKEGESWRVMLWWD